MIYIEIIFWILVSFVFYTYVGYPIFLFFLSKRESKGLVKIENYEPTVTLFVTAYNEEDYIDIKIENSLELDYPADKIEYIWVTDGSNDKTNEKLKKYPFVKTYYQKERKGKINAMNRGVQFVNTDIVIFSDGNTKLSKNTITEIVKSFANKNVGCVAGEKRIELAERDTAATNGEGFYWKYESWIKQLDAKVGSCIGAAGELFAIRRELFEKVPEDTILDDFIISLNIAMKGFKIDYTPKAYAEEKASASISEEMKRKVRIAAGSIQSLVRLSSLLNIFKYKMLSFQYFSHKIMRWIITPVSLLFLIPLNILLIKQNDVYLVLLIIQTLFYIFVFIGWILRNKKIGLGIIFVPYYFFIANLSMWLGFFRYLRGKQTVNWERAKRAV